MAGYIHRREHNRKTFGPGRREIKANVEASGIPDDVSTPNVKPLRDTPELRKIASGLKDPKKKK